MPMKVSLALGRAQGLSRQTAWGCLTTNLAMPGFGSLMAGRVSGYPQVVLTFVGLALTLVCGGRFVLWCLANWARLHAPEADPLAALLEMWIAMRWAVAGIGIFFLSLLWALATSFQIIRAAKLAESAGVPPKLG